MLLVYVSPEEDTTGVIGLISTIVPIDIELLGIGIRAPPEDTLGVVGLKLSTDDPPVYGSRYHVFLLADGSRCHIFPPSG